MSHGVRINNDLFYIDGVVAPASYWETLDAVLAQAMNGDGGGTWAPASGISVGGAGMWFCGIWTMSGGARQANLIGSGTRITLGDNDYVQLAPGHTGRTRAIYETSGTFVEMSDLSTSVQYANAYDSPETSKTTATGAPRILIPLRAHNGATFTQVLFSIFVTGVHTGVPVNLPQFRVIKVDAAGNVTPLNTTAAALNGFLPFSPAPASGAAWQDGSARQTFVYALDAGVVIDRSKYEYFAEVLDEYGTNAVAQNVFGPPQCIFTNIADQRPQ